MPKPLNGGSHNSDYNLQDGWNSAMWGHTYAYVFPQIYQSEQFTRTGQPAFFRYNENIEGGGHAPCDRLLRPDCVHQFCRS